MVQVFTEEENTEEIVGKNETIGVIIGEEEGVVAAVIIEEIDQFLQEGIAPFHLPPEGLNLHPPQLVEAYHHLRLLNPLNSHLVNPKNLPFPPNNNQNRLKI